MPHFYAAFHLAKVPVCRYMYPESKVLLNEGTPKISVFNITNVIVMIVDDVSMACTSCHGFSTGSVVL